MSCPICDAPMRGRWCSRCTSPRVRAVLPRTTTDHLRLELAHVARNGPLGDADPVPGCDCPACLTLAGGGTTVHAEYAGHVVTWLAGLEPDERTDDVRALRADLEAEGGTWRLPGPIVLASLAAKVPGAVRPTVQRVNGRTRDPLPVDEARNVDILAVVQRLGLGDPERKGREHVVRCPFHDDERPSLRIDADAGLWYCDPCGFGGDAIRLYELATGQRFAEAVRELAR